MDCSPPGFSVPGILQARKLERVAIPFSRGSSQIRDRTRVSCIAGRFFTIWPIKSIARVIWVFTRTRKGETRAPTRDLAKAGWKASCWCSYTNKKIQNKEFNSNYQTFTTFKGLYYRTELRSARPPRSRANLLTLGCEAGKVQHLFTACQIRHFPGDSDGKASACNAGDLGLIPGLGSSPGEGNGNPLQYSCLEKSMDGGAW